MASETWASARVDEGRLWDRHMAMAKIGATAKGGCNRAALTDLDIEARALFAGWARELGFGCSIDSAGNLFARREGRDPDAPPVVSGSHLDTQPSGGRFDGIFGVLAALEALEAIETAGIDTVHPLEAAVWTNEEGVRFQPGCLGSLAFTYPDRLEAVLDTVDEDGVTLRQAVERYRERDPEAGQYPPHRPIHAFVEAHIEQGPILEQRGQTIGIVTGIQGSRRFTVEVHGEDAHAGTTPRAGRKDAVSAAVAMIGALEEVFHDDPEDITRFTVGRFVVSPNALAVVPGYVMFTIDFRQPHDDVLVRLGDRVEGICKANAQGVRCGRHPDGAHAQRAVRRAGTGDHSRDGRETPGAAHAHLLRGGARRQAHLQLVPHRNDLRPLREGNQPQRDRERIPFRSCGGGTGAGGHPGEACEP